VNGVLAVSFGVGTFAADVEAFDARRANSADIVDTAPAYSVAAIRDVNLELEMDHEDFLRLEVPHFMSNFFDDAYTLMAQGNPE
jgi:hypothetical protein